MKTTPIARTESVNYSTAQSMATRKTPSPNVEIHYPI